MTRPAFARPYGWWSDRKRDLHIRLIDRGFLSPPPVGAAGLARVGHRAYVGRDWDGMGSLQFRFLRAQGLASTDVLCDVGCGSFRTGRLLIPFLDRGHYLGLDRDAALVERGLTQELDPALVSDKAPELVISDRFEFGRFSRAPTVAWAVSLFTHLNAGDIMDCLTQLRRHSAVTCRCFATFFEVPSPVRNYRLSHPRLGFHYTRAQVSEFGERAGWRAEYLGEWGDEVGRQMMMRYS